METAEQEMESGSIDTALVFYVNQVKVTEENPNPEDALIDYLRRKLHLTGTKLVCGEGGCGACTVMISRHRSDCDVIENLSVNACLTPLCSVHGAAVTTIEGIGSSSSMHPLQQRLTACHGSQCGFCTPGMLMTAYAELRNNSGKGTTQRQLEEALQGNLCRCTGYRPIMEAFAGFASGCCGKGRSCCLAETPDRMPGVRKSKSCTTDAKQFLPYDPSQEPIFPSELQLKSKHFDSRPLRFASAEVTWHRPVTLRSLLQLKWQFPEAKIINGNTEVGVELKSKKLIYPHLIHAAFVKELQELTFNDTGVTIGAGVTLTRLLTQFRKELQKDGIGCGKRRTLEAFVGILRLFSGQQIRNVAAIGGNIMTASPVSDLNPLLMACGASLTLESLNGGCRTQQVSPEFFPSYRRTAAENREILVRLRVPFCDSREHLVALKQSRRRDDDIAIVNMAARVRFDKSNSPLVSDAAITCGGMSATTGRATRAESALIGRSWGDPRLLTEAQESLGGDFEMRANAPGGQVRYRKTLAASLLARCFHQIGLSLLADSELSGLRGNCCYADESIANELERKLTVGCQMFDVTDVNEPVGQSVGHVASAAQARGKAEFVDDMPAAGSELFAYPVLSNCATGRLDGLDFSSAESLPGVLGFLTWKDSPGSNWYGPAVKDDRFFVVDDIRFCGDVVAAVVAVDRSTARRAARLVRPLIGTSATRPIVTVSDAIAAGSFFEEAESRVVDGDAAAAIELLATRAIEGEMSVGGQEHFYFETQACLAVPKDGGTEMILHSSTQNPSYLQREIASLLDLPCHRVTVKVKRLGGGFGGKEYKCVGVAGIAAVAAKKFDRPVRVTLDREEDMVMTGTRHPVFAKYRAGVDSNNRIVGLVVDAFMNGGFSRDASALVAECYAMKVFSGYRVPASDIRVRVCRTNTPSTTAFRGFGAPQAVLLMESIMSRLAEAVGVAEDEIREANLLEAGQVSPYGQVYEHLSVRECWRQCRRVAEFERRLREIREFNDVAKGGAKRRGLAMTALNYGMGFGSLALHQAGAIVNIYLDGSVLITHGGVEMGQGLHTKLVQVASHCLNLPTSRIFISETATDKVPNTTSTAASFTTDLNAPAVMDACRQLMLRLSPYRQSQPNAGWDAWVNAAYSDGVSLSANGFFHNDDCRPGENLTRFFYFTSGAACAEVEIDCLTGDHVVRRVDIVMDLGDSLNPAIDIGQVEGAFVQGYGLCTLEEQRYSPAGHLYTRGPGAYKLPGFGDIPEQLRVHLLSDRPCGYKHAVYSSKGVGEPPLCLAASVFIAIRSAVNSARKFAGLTEIDRFDSPATCERIRMACGDWLARDFTEAYELSAGTEPWELKLAE